MAKWDNLKLGITEIIKPNDDQLITGEMLQFTLLDMINSIGQHATYKGVASASTSPGFEDGPVFYLAAGPATFPNFSGLILNEGEAGVLYWNGTGSNSWVKHTVNFATQRQVADLGAGFIAGNNSYPNISLQGNNLTLNSNGFSYVRSGSNNPFYVAYVAGEDSTETYTFDRKPSVSRTFYVLDTSVLVENTRVAFSKAIKCYENNLANAKPSDVLLCAFYYGQLTPTAGLLADFIASEQAKQALQMPPTLIAGNNGTYPNIVLDGSNIIINSNGFSYKGIDKKLYFVGYVAGIDTSNTFTMSGRGLTHARTYYVLDTSALVENTRVAFSKAIKVVDDYTDNLPTYVLLCAFYQDEIVPTAGLLAGFIASEQAKQEAEYQGIEELPNKVLNESLFDPEYYAYKHSRENNNEGVGIGWRERFKLLHISDTHHYIDLVKQSIEVSGIKVDVICNTGDDANGLTAADADVVKAQLSSTAAAVTQANSLRKPYLCVKGNHDVTGLTQQDYFDRMCVLMEQFGIVNWGNLEGHRAYGYVDVVDYDSNIIRIVMLDPFDYDDGLFGTTYEHMSAVFSQEQIDWLCATLAEAANTGKRVITMMHYSFGDNSLDFNEDTAKPDALFYQDAFMIPDIIWAAKNRQVINKTYSDSAGLNNVNVYADFSHLPANLDYICHLFGHIHSKNWYRCKSSSKDYGFLMLGEASLGAYGNALNKAYREPGAVNEIAFSILEIDTTEKKIYRVAYGSYLNYDRSNTLLSRTAVFNYGSANIEPIVFDNTVFTDEMKVSEHVTIDRRGYITGVMYTGEVDCTGYTQTEGAFVVQSTEPMELDTNVNIYQGLNVTNNATVGGRLSANALIVNGKTVFTDEMKVSEHVTIDRRGYITGVMYTGEVDCTGYTQTEGAFVVQSTEPMELDTNVNIYQGLNVTNNATVGGRLSANALIVNGETVLQDLSVLGSAMFNSGLWSIGRSSFEYPIYMNCEMSGSYPGIYMQEMNELEHIRVIGFSGDAAGNEYIDIGEEQHADSQKYYRGIRLNGAINTVKGSLRVEESFTSLGNFNLGDVMYYTTGDDRVDFSTDIILQIVDGLNGREMEHGAIKSYSFGCFDYIRLLGLTKNAFSTDSIPSLEIGSAEDYAQDGYSGIKLFGDTQIEGKLEARSGVVLGPSMITVDASKAKVTISGQTVRFDTSIDARGSDISARNLALYGNIHLGFHSVTALGIHTSLTTEHADTGMLVHLIGLQDIPNGMCVLSIGSKSYASATAPDAIALVTSYESGNIELIGNVYIPQKLKLGGATFTYDATNDCIVCDKRIANAGAGK